MHSDPLFIALFPLQGGREGAVVVWAAVICVTFVLHIRCEDDMIHGGVFHLCLLRLHWEFLLLLLSDLAHLPPGFLAAPILPALLFPLNPLSTAL